jgi:CubicO group peptidase (beta-lactamase class C family)
MKQTISPIVFRSLCLLGCLAATMLGCGNDVPTGQGRDCGANDIDCPHSASCVQGDGGQDGCIADGVVSDATLPPSDQRQVDATVDLCSQNDLKNEITSVLNTLQSTTSFSVYLERRDGASYTFETDGSSLDTVYESASTSKLVTATIILWALESLDNFNLSDQPQNHLDFWVVPQTSPLNSIQLHHLLSFTSGLTEESRCLKLGLPRRLSMNDCLELVLSDNMTEGSIAGQAFHYASTHLQVAGAMAVAAGGYNDWTSLFDAFKTATGLFPTARYDLPSETNPRLAGGMHWTGTQYAAFLGALIRGEIISQQSFETMTTTHTDQLPSSYSPAEAEGFPWQYGYGLWVECGSANVCIDAEYRSSPGAYGAYPFFRVDGTYWGVVARQGSLGTFPEGVEIGLQIRSLAEKWSACPHP